METVHSNINTSNAMLPPLDEAVSSDHLLVRHWPLSPYALLWAAMRTFTESRTSKTPDELWIVQHFPVFTLGQGGRPEHILNPSHIPIVHSDRGGQVTYHGPGQLVFYTLLDLQRQQLSAHRFVHQLEQSIIDLLALWNIASHRKLKAPGVYIEGAKIAAIGLRLRRQCSYHGLSFNVDMDLTPFKDIHPCGYPNQTVTHLKHFKADCTVSSVIDKYLMTLPRYLTAIKKGSCHAHTTL